MNYIVLQKSEWDRLQKQAGLSEAPDELKHQHEVDRRVQTLNEKSQKWISTWPDSLQPVADKVEKRNHKRREKNKKMIKDYKELQELMKSEKFNTIQKAKQRIFETTGYGKELLSALTASKTLEEREAQLKFQKEMKRKEMELENEFGPKRISLDLGHDYETEDVAEKNKAKEIEQINREIYKRAKEKLTKDKQKEIKLELEDARRMENLLEFESRAMDHCKGISVQIAKDFEAEQRKFRETRAVREKLDEDIAKVWSDYHDRVRCKEREVTDRIHKRRYNQPHLKLNYELTEKLNTEANRRYQDFIDKGVERMKTELTKKEQGDTEKSMREKEMHMKVIELNKTMAKEKQEVLKEDKLCCERQSLFTQSCKNKNVKDVCPADKEEGVYHPPPFLPRRRCNELELALRKREQQPSPWNAREAAHAYFARQAGDILAQCKYKSFARKVVDEYRRGVNCLDATTLPVPNY